MVPVMAVMTSKMYVLLNGRILKLLMDDLMLMKILLIDDLMPMKILLMDDLILMMNGR